MDLKQQKMEVNENSQFSVTESYLGSSVVSDSSELLNSRLSNQDMEKMEKQSLLCKLLELFEALQNTERDNQLLRIEKAQLRTQLKKCKSQAENFIQTNIKKARQIPLNRQNQNHHKIVHQSNLNQPMLNSFMTPYESEQQYGRKANKVFVKSHQRGISNITINQINQPFNDQKKAYKTSMNTPVNRSPEKYTNNQRQKKQSSFKKLNFPKSQLEALVLAQREEEYQEQKARESQTLDNFQSFYYKQRQDFGQTQRIGTVSNSLQKRKDPFQEFNQKWKRQNQSSSIGLSDRNSQKGINRSMSSSNFSNQKYEEKGFKIPNSIDEIWGPSNSNSSQNIFQRVNLTSNKLSKVSKVNALTSKMGAQRKTYLNN